MQGLREHDPFLGRIIDHQHAVHTGFAGRSSKGLDAHRLDRVGIAHQDNRRLAVVGPESDDHREHLPEADALRQCPLRGTLYGGPVGHRIGERHAKLDDVGTCADQRMQQGHGQCRVGVTCGNERDQGLAPLPLQALEYSLYFRHGQNVIPDFSATVCISLSPRPERLTSRILSFGRVGASLPA
jgi:hypothetical protein